MKKQKSLDSRLGGNDFEQDAEAKFLQLEAVSPH
jgi:hypothetical protein